MNLDLATRSLGGLKFVSDMPQRGPRSAAFIQRKAIASVLEFLGDAVSTLATRVGRDVRKSNQFCCMSSNSVDTRFPTFLKYEETPHDSRVSRRCQNKRQQSTFDYGDVEALKTIIKARPDLYLNKIRKVMFAERGKRWAESTSWRKLTSLGYNLKKAVF